jgi:thioredoxin reductase (NADPH)
MSSHKVAIIGSGPSGLTAAIYTSRANLETTVYQGTQPGGQLTTTTEIENFPGFVEGIMGPQLMDNMQKQAVRFGSKTVYDTVTNIEVTKSNSGNKYKLTLLNNSTPQEFDAVIIASGASARYLGIEGEEKFIGKGYHSCATCDGFFYKNKVIAVIGGGDSAAEEANFLTKFADKVYLIHRKDQLRASKIMAQRVLNNPKVEPIWNSVVTDFIGTDEVKGVVLESTIDRSKKDLVLDGVFVAIGHIPNSDFAKQILTMDEAGYLIPQWKMNPESRTSKYNTMSNIEGIFIAGDVEDTIYRQAITAAGDGCRAAMEVEKWLEEQND